jgi:hypothetical protein
MLGRGPGVEGESWVWRHLRAGLGAGGDGGVGGGWGDGQRGQCGQSGGRETKEREPAAERDGRVTC